MGGSIFRDHYSMQVRCNFDRLATWAVVRITRTIKLKYIICATTCNLLVKEKEGQTGTNLEGELLLFEKENLGPPRRLDRTTRRMLVISYIPPWRFPVRP